MTPSPTVLHADTHEFEEVADLIKECPDSSRSFFVVPVAEKKERVSQIVNARAVSLHNQVVVHVSELSPLGITVLADMLHVAQESLSTAQLVAFAAELENAITCSAYLRSVTKLQVSRTTMWHHVMSWLPSTRFVATAHDGVHSAKKFDQDEEYWEENAHEVLFISDSSEQKSLITPQSVAELAQASSVTGRNIDSRGFWGVEPVFEWVFAPTDLWAYVDNIKNRSTLCSWCSEPYVPPRCAVCSAPSLIGESE
ncbi:hypothetical protein [uncultured Brevibacterium sp.]|uniref:hypothetical protein n=1 Tax=uncultured Brevibacterium sp. TaxID=189678 RepID=UPI0025E19376|nr:hypothetical protein [uncultured Brevibacterium sp.]